MNSQSMEPLEALIDRYCEAWSCADPSLRRQLLDESVSLDVVYTDPSVGPLDRAALESHIDRLAVARPGTCVSRCSEVDLHHAVARFQWRAVDGDGRLLREGLDIVELNASGNRLRRILGFFGDLPPLGERVSPRPGACGVAPVFVRQSR